MKLLNFIQKTWIINNNITRIGVNNSLVNNINRSSNYPVLFIPKKCMVEDIGTIVNKNQVIGSLYNKITRCEYLLYSPIKGTIININDDLINNIHSIRENPIAENWLIDIEPEFKLQSKYHWWY
jgi:glycine cleavage system H lipoate-binding protein